jgi:predicted DCC family thiol-disulfide oxidoreductase YuxK
MGKHILFYDSTCGMCHRAVQFTLLKDRNKSFVFAPLNGETAKEYPLPDVDSLILVENFDDPEKQAIYTFGKGFLRTMRHLGGLWRLFSYLPAFPVDIAYRWIAKRRYKWFESPNCPIPSNSDKKRFLP